MNAAFNVLSQSFHGFLLHGKPGWRWAVILLVLLAAPLYSVGLALAQGSPPEPPDTPTYSAIFLGGIDVEWNEDANADSYDIQVNESSTGDRVDLPHGNIEVAAYGAGAVVSALDQAGYYLRVRANNENGSSDWTQYILVQPTWDLGQIGRRSRPANMAPTGLPSIVGDAKVGIALTADASAIEDNNGLDSVRFHYQWFSSNGGAATDIQGATEATHIVKLPDTGQSIGVRVSFFDRHGYAESLESLPTAPVLADLVNSPATGEPVVKGTAEVSDTLTADISGISDANGLVNATFSYQWIANDGTADTDIAGATSSTHTLTADDEGKTVWVRVSFTDDLGFEETLTSEPTTAVIVRVNSPASGTPVISGTTEVSDTLTADISGISDADGLVNATFNYQWIANDGTADTYIVGATSSTHTLTVDDEGKTVWVRVSFTDDYGFEETLTSEPTAAVTMAPLRLGSANVNEDTLVLTYIEVLDPSVTLSVSVFTVMVDGSDRQVDNVTVANRTVILILASAVESGETVQVGYSRPAGPDYVRDNTLSLAAESFSGQAVSNETTGPQPPAAPQGLTATSNEDGTISLAWDDPGDPTVAGYQIRRRRPTVDPVGVPYETLVYDTGSAATSFVDTPVAAWTEYKYRVRARNADGLSGDSDTVDMLNTHNGTTLVSNRGKGF